MRITRRLRLLVGYSVATVGLLYSIAALVLPLWLENYATHQIKSMSGSYVTFSKVSVSLLHGTYTLSNIELQRKSSDIPFPFFRAKEIQFSISGYDLLFAKVRGKITVIDPELNFVVDHMVTKTQVDIDYPWVNVCQRLAGIPLSEVKVVNGRVTYLDRRSIPNVDLAMSNICLIARNLDQQPDEDDELKGNAEATASIYEAKLFVTMKFNPTEHAPIFNVKARLEDLDLSYLNDYLKANGNYSVEKGMFSLIAEASGVEESVSGFVKPELETINFASYSSSPIKTSTSPFSSPFPQISFQEQLQDASFSLWSATAFTLRNAFLEGIMPVVKKTNTSREQQPKHQRVIIPRVPLRKIDC